MVYWFIRKIKVFKTEQRLLYQRGIIDAAASTAIHNRVIRRHNFCRQHVPAATAKLSDDSSASSSART